MGLSLMGFVKKETYCITWSNRKLADCWKKSSTDCCRSGMEKESNMIRI